MRTSLRLASVCAAAVLLASALAACGGGGGSSGGGSNSGGGGNKPGPGPATPSFTVGGTASGLGGALTLLNNGADSLTLSAPGGSFQFATALAAGAAYRVTVGKEPFGQACPVTNGSGTISASVTNVSVSCGPATVVSAYDFGTASTDGEAPEGGLTLGSNGNYYGVTSEGGLTGAGTVFRLSPNGTLTTLHDFEGAPEDGAEPMAPPFLASNGNLYGTTNAGGASGYGTVYMITPSGTESILYSFTGGADGAKPRSPFLLASNGKLYSSTTFGGGLDNHGTLFSIDPADNSYAQQISFQGYVVDGPKGALVQARNGWIYGTSLDGGKGGQDYGTVYAIDPGTTPATLEVVESLVGPDQGTGPLGGLVLASDRSTMYGVVGHGGAKAGGGVFKFSSVDDGYTLLYSFAGAPRDGALPDSTPVIGPDGKLYELTYKGGAYNEGALVSIDLEASPVSRQLLFSFGGISPGAMSNLSDQMLLLGSNNSIYGVAGNGGANNLGAIWAFD